MIYYIAYNGSDFKEFASVQKAFVFCMKHRNYKLITIKCS